MTVLRRALKLRPSLPTGLALLALAIASTGTAAAATGQLVNITDPITTANKAKVNTSGQLLTSAVVPAGVAPAAPKTPFSLAAITYTDGTPAVQFGGTTATIALTGMSFANGTTSATTVDLYQFGEPTATCNTSSSYTNVRLLEEVIVPSGETYQEQRTTPLVLKPLSGGAYHCLATIASGTNYGLYGAFNGYVISGSFAPASPAKASGKLLQPGAPITR